MFRLSITKLRAAAEAKGDKTQYAIAKRTGLDQSAISRIVNGRFQPDLNSVLLMASAYDTTVEALVERINAEAAEAAA